MRTFKLINSTGNVLDLTSKKILLTNPSGLGFSKNIDFLKNGNNYKILNTELEQKQIDADLIIKSYETLEEFKNFSARSPLILEYFDTVKTKYINCELTNLNLTEKSSKSLMLEIPITFTALSDWYTSIKIYTTSTDCGKKYPFKYPYKYRSAAVGKLNIENISNKISTVKLILEGPLINPEWELFNNNNSIISGKLNYSINENEKIIINSIEGSEEIAVYDLLNNRIESIYDYSDFNTTRFIYLEPFTEYMLNVNHEGANKIKAFVEIINNEI